MVCEACGGEIYALLASKRKYCLACSTDRDRKRIFLDAKKAREDYLESINGKKDIGRIDKEVS